MKKVISFALILVIVFSFVGCGNVSKEIKDGINSALVQVPTPKPTAILTSTPTPDPRIAMREEYSRQIDEAVANSGVKLVAIDKVMTDEDKIINGMNVYMAKYYTYFNSLAGIQSNLNEDNDTCWLFMYLNPNE